MPEPVRVFVSYASPDRAFAGRLVNDLKAAGAEVWWDVTGIDEGDFLDKINEALRQCQWLVLVLTPNAIASKWVKIEVNAAINRREKGLMRGVLPVLASSVAHDAIPPVWDTLHRYDAVRDYPVEVARLIRTLDLSGAPAEPPQTPNAPPDHFPPRLIKLGYRLTSLNGTEFIMPPLCDVFGGPFLMGSDKQKDPQAADDERPQASIALATFQIGKYPVTVAEYACFVRSGQEEPSRWQEQLSKLDHPVSRVSWHDAVSYIQWLSKHSGQPWKLPSEAEWEKAARGTDGRIYPWGDNFDSGRCNSFEGKRRDTTPVGSYPTGASPYGILDMAGNVWEWTSDLYKPYPGGNDTSIEQTPRTEQRVSRGGSYDDRAGFVRSAYRYVGFPSLIYRIGFRMALAAAS